MAKIERLLDVYRFPGFVPQAKVSGVFGEPLAVVVTLLRSRKKRVAVFAGKLALPTTTSVPGASATWPAATNASISPSRLEGSFVPDVAA
jgi:hypothetical protein